MFGPEAQDVAAQGKAGGIVLVLFQKLAQLLAEVVQKDIWHGEAILQEALLRRQTFDSGESMPKGAA